MIKLRQRLIWFEKIEKYLLTSADRCVKLFKAKSKKQSRVSTLTIAQAGDYWSDIET